MTEAVAKIDIMPAHHRLSVEINLSGSFVAAEPAFYLNKDFKIQSVAHRGKVIPFRVDLEADSLPFNPTSRPVYIDRNCDQIMVHYTGTLQEPTGMDNVIRPERVELSLHSCFYPARIGDNEITSHDVHITLPAEYLLLANGDRYHRSVADGLCTHSFHVVSDEVGVFVFAAPTYRVIRSEYHRPELSAVFLDPRDKPMAEDGLSNLKAAMELYEQKFGPLKQEHPITFVVSPRGSGGYAFGSIIVVPNQGDFRFANDDYRHVMLPVHEAAHLYWDFSSFTNNEDWIIEGLAEYSAMSFMLASTSDQTINQMLDSQMQELLACQTSDAVVATPFASKDSTTNRYTKPAWVYSYIARNSARLDGVLASLYQAHSGATPITTHMFLNALKGSLTDGDWSIVHDLLSKPGWNAADVSKLRRRIQRIA